MAAARVRCWDDLPPWLVDRIIRFVVDADPRIIPIEADFGTAQQFFDPHHSFRKTVRRSMLPSSHGVDTISIEDAKNACIVEKPLVKFTSAAPLPVLFCVSQSIRRSAMEHYMLGFKGTGRPLYWNPEIDTIFFWHKHLFTEQAYEGLSLSMLEYALSHYGSCERYWRSFVHFRTIEHIQHLAIDMKALKYASNGDFEKVNGALLTTENALAKFTSLKKLTLVAFASDVQDIAKKDISKLTFNDAGAELDLVEIRDYREKYEGKEDSMQDALASMVGDLAWCELEVKCLGEQGDFARFEDCERTDEDDS